MSRARATGPMLEERTLVRRSRLLPVPGRVLVRAGDEVAPETVLAEASRPGPLHVLDLASALGLAPAEVPATLLVGPGDRVEAGQVVGRARGWFGRGGRVYRAPAAGTLVSLSPVTGRALLQGPARPLLLRAWLPGRVEEVVPAAGAVLALEATLLQGVFGLGGACSGPLRLAVNGPAEVLSAEDLPPDAAGAVLVTGAGVTAAAFAAAGRAGVVALITGGLGAAELLGRPGAEAALAGSGDPPAGPAIVVTEGFGRVPMLEERFRLLQRREGCLACVSAATQIRAGTIRPEIVVPWPDRTGARAPAPAPALRIGAQVRVAVPPWLGRQGQVAELPPGRLVLPSGAEAEAAVVALEPDGLLVAVALANLECA